MVRGQARKSLWIETFAQEQIVIIWIGSGS